MNEQDQNLENVEKVLKDSPLNNPDITFCEKTTYLDFLLSNAKDKDEELQIKETINGYLDIYDDEEDEESSDSNGK